MDIFWGMFDDIPDIAALATEKKDYDHLSSDEILGYLANISSLATPGVGDDGDPLDGSQYLIPYFGPLCWEYGKRVTNGASPFKFKSGKRRTKLETAALKAVTYCIVDSQKPMTVRQVYYRLVVGNFIDKTEAEYDTVCRILGQMRRNETLSYHWLADNTRWMRKPTTYSGLDQMLEINQQAYRRALWEDQKAYVEIWLEKETLAGVLVDVTQEYDVPLMVTRGYPSLSFVHSAGETLEELCKPAYLYYFGDRDPSGVDIDRKLEEDLRKFAPYCDLTFERVAVLPEQIEELDLPTRPTKKSDSRSKNFDGESVEVDAIEPDMLRDMCRDCITQHINKAQLKRTRKVEKLERETLAMYAKDFEGDKP
jgi:hypothetical protein